MYTFRKKLQDLGVNLSLDYYVIISIANIYCISLPNALIYRDEVVNLTHFEMTNFPPSSQLES